MQIFLGLPFLINILSKDFIMLVGSLTLILRKTVIKLAKKLLALTIWLKMLKLEAEQVLQLDYTETCYGRKQN